MTIDEAVSLVLQAGTLRGVGDIHVLEMGSPIRIRDLAESLLILSGYTPDVDVEIRYTGMRAGEKLTEELFHSGAKISESPYRGIYIEQCEPECNGLLEHIERTEMEIHGLKEQKLKGIMDNIIRNSSPASSSSITST